MQKRIDAAAVGRMMRRDGMPAQPQVLEQVSEVRSDCFVDLSKIMMDQAAPGIGAAAILWRYSVPYGKVSGFHAFLAENERFISESCEKTMSGVHYRGTYMVLFGPRCEYMTFWNYDSWDAQREWSKVTGNKRSRFYQALRTLRSYSVSDPASANIHLGAAAGIDPNQGFFSISMDADTPEGEAPSTRRPARRKS